MSTTKHQLERVTGAWHRCSQCGREMYGPIEQLKPDAQQCDPDHDSQVMQKIRRHADAQIASIMRRQI